MNLTSKRMLQFIAGCAGVFALAATAADQTFYVKDSFEDGSLGLLVGQYKETYSEPDGNGRVTTNHVWNAQDDDASELVANVGSYTGTRPITNAVTTDLVLNLETEGQTLVRTLDGGVTKNFGLGNDPVFVDTLIKFTPSEDNPTIEDAQVKAAVFVNVYSNLVVYHGVFGGSATMTDVNYPIDPTQWYRLTIRLSNIGTTEDTGFQVWLNGIPVTNAVCTGDDQSIFVNASSDLTISAISFQGTGMVDDLVVSDQAVGISQTTIMLTLSFDDALMDVVQGATTLVPDAQIEAGSSITINNVKDWYELTSVTGTGVTYSDSASLGAGLRAKSSTGTVAADATATVTISAAQYSSGTVNTGLGTDLPADKVVAWANAQVPQLGEGDLTSDMLDNYLFNVDKATTVNLKIASITPTETGADIVITTDNTTAVPELQQINGTLKVFGTDDLTTGFAGHSTSNITVGASSSVTVSITTATGKFIKAVIE